MEQSVKKQNPEYSTRFNNAPFRKLFFRSFALLLLSLFRFQLLLLSSTANTTQAVGGTAALVQHWSSLCLRFLCCDFSSVLRVTRPVFGGGRLLPFIHGIAGPKMGQQQDTGRATDRCDYLGLLAGHILQIAVSTKWWSRLPLSIKWCEARSARERLSSYII